MGDLGQVLAFHCFFETSNVGQAALDEFSSLLQPLASQPGGRILFTRHYIPFVTLVGPDISTPSRLWEYKKSQYVTRPLSLAEMTTLVEGCLTPPPGYTLNVSASNPVGNSFSIACSFEPVEGLMTQPAPTDMAFSHRNPGFLMAVIVGINPTYKGAIQAVIKYQRQLFNEYWEGIVGPESYQNYPYNYWQPPALALAAYYAPNLCRLVQIKAKYDLNNVFGSQQQGIPTSLGSCPSNP